ncbi:MAG: TadE/TadG family type IV pilus assembly protein [Paracoccaceae bacterium]
MMNRSLGTAFKDYLRDDRATMLVEFVISAPFLFFWLIGSFVFFDAYRASNQAEKATFTIGDIVSRLTVVDDDYVDELFQLQNSLLPKSRNNGWIRITSIIYDEDDDEYQILWTEHRGEGSVPLLQEDLNLELMPTMADADTIVLVETHVPYYPLSRQVGITVESWDNQLTYRPRFVGSLAYSP